MSARLDGEWACPDCGTDRGPCFCLDPEPPTEGDRIGEPWPYAHLQAWHGYLSRAANQDDAPAPEIVRRTHRIERAYARLARAPKLDWWGK